MQKLAQYRWWILGAAIGVLLLPTYLVLASPIGSQNISPPDLAFTKDWPYILILIVLVVIVIALLVWFFVRLFPREEPKVAIKTPEGQPDKVVSVNEMVGITFSKILEFMERNQTSQERTANHFSQLVQTIMADVNQHTDATNTILLSFKDELIQGRGNQMSAIIEVSDVLRDRLRSMETGLTTRNEQMERVNGGIGYLQLGQTKMQKDLEALLEETRKLTQSITDILFRIETIGQTVNNVNESETAVKDELKELTALVHSLDERLNRISIAAGNSLSMQSALKPDEPAQPVKE